MKLASPQLETTKIVAATPLATNMPIANSGGVAPNMAKRDESVKKKKKESKNKNWATPHSGLSAVANDPDSGGDATGDEHADRQ